MTIHRDDGYSGRTKLERVSLRSAKDKEVVFNNLWHLIDIPLLKETFHRLNGRKAIGIDGVTKESYEKNLEENLQNLMQNIRRGLYRPQAARLVEIPKEDGSTRPLAISCLEDKLVQSVVNEILVSIFESRFLPVSYGFRPGRNCHQALRALSSHSYAYSDGGVVEIDLRRCFNTLPHSKVMECLQKKISDKRFLRLVHRLMQTPMTKATEEAVPNAIGCPQGSIISPTIANIYLHEVVDEWFEMIKRKHFRGKAAMVRYCDDMIFLFQKLDDAQRFYRVLPKRLEKYGLILHTEKSQLLRSGRMAAREAEERGERLPTYKFLGFTCYWGMARKGFWRLKLTSRKDRFTAKLKGLRQYLRERLNTPDTPGILKQVVRVVKGWVNYHAVSDNERRVKSFVNHAKTILFAWFNRRGKKNAMVWKTLQRVLERYKYPTAWKTVSMFPKAGS